MWKYFKYWWAVALFATFILVTFSPDSDAQYIWLFPPKNTAPPVADTRPVDNGDPHDPLTWCRPAGYTYRVPFSVCQAAAQRYANANRPVTREDLPQVQTIRIELREQYHPTISGDDFYDPPINNDLN